MSVLLHSSVLEILSVAMRHQAEIKGKIIGKEESKLVIFRQYDDVSFKKLQENQLEGLNINSE